MKLSPALEVAPRTAVTVTVLAVLLASVVAGHENPQPAPAPAAIAQAQPPARARPTGAELDLERIKRSAKEETIPELFAPRGWEADSARRAAKPRPGPPPAPTAPPLPFSYLGKLIDGERTVVFLARGERTYSVEPGTQVDEIYRLEQARPAELTFTYLPLGTRQALAIPALN